MIISYTPSINWKCEWLTWVEASGTPVDKHCSLVACVLDTWMLTPWSLFNFFSMASAVHVLKANEERPCSPSKAISSSSRLSSSWQWILDRFKCRSLWDFWHSCINFNMPSGWTNLKKHSLVFFIINSSLWQMCQLLSQDLVHQWFAARILMPLWNGKATKAFKGYTWPFVSWMESW